MSEQKKNGRSSEKQLDKFRRASQLKRRAVVIIPCVLLALILVGVLAVRSLFVKPELPGGSQLDPPAGGTGDPSFTSTSTPSPWDELEGGVRPRSDGERKSEDFYTILILGRDTGGGGNTDTILLASYDVTDQKAAVMSIPRDTMVNVPWDVKKLNSVYGWYGGGEDGIQRVYQEIAQLVGFEPDFRVVVEWEAVGQIVDAIGGVWFDVPYNMDYQDPDQDLTIYQEAGYRLLDGEDAMEVIRWRQNSRYSPFGSISIGDSGRMQLQQDFLKAVVSQLLTVENIGNIGKIADVFKNSVTTDLSFQNILWFGQQAVLGGLSASDVDFITMPYQGAYAWSRSYDTELAYVVPIGSQLLELVNGKLSPFTEAFSLSDLDIMSVNADGSVSSSSGYVLDEPATYPRSYWDPPEPSDGPSDSPEPDPSDEPTDSPEPEPSDESTDSPGPDPSGEPSDSPEPDPSGEPTDSPEPDPSGEPTDSPEPDPSTEPTNSPEPDPSGEPVSSPEPDPSGDPEPSPPPEPSGEPESDPGEGAA